MSQTARSRIEIPTLVLLILTYVVLGLATMSWHLSGLVSVLVTGWCLAQFSSLQHEALHGHPTRHALVNEALVFPGLSLTVPYRRFRDTHLQHHYDPNLTDPYDDPESNFVDPSVWTRFSAPLRWILRINNTLLGRITLGPVIGTVAWLMTEARLIARGHPGVALGWGLHVLGMVPVFVWLAWVGMPVWAYVLAVYLSNALLRIRTFLEHRAHDLSRARTVIIEDQGPLALLFLNNNFHAVHHMHPGVAWYDLPALYRSRKDHYRRRNDDYVYRSYGQIFRTYLLNAKDPVPHPIWPVKKDDRPDL